MNNKKAKRVISWHTVKGSTTLQPKHYIDDKEVTKYEYYGLGDYVDADVPTLEALLEKTREEEPYDGAEFQYEWKPKMSLIKGLISKKKGPRMEQDSDGLWNIFF